MASPGLKIAVGTLLIAGLATILARQYGQMNRLRDELNAARSATAATDSSTSATGLPVAPLASGPSEELLRLRGEVAQLRSQQAELARLRTENQRLRTTPAPAAVAPRPAAITEEQFLAANAAAEGVIQTASGLQYKIVSSGTGRTPKPTDTVKVRYHGKLIDGTVFDSSLHQNEPTMKLPVGGVIAGWSEALQMMKEGDKWELFIPSKLAYGEKGAGTKIGPKTLLIFELELLGIEP